MYKKYKENINGIIITLLFHIVLFTVLNITQFNKKVKIEEAEIVFDFQEEFIEPTPPKEVESNNNQQSGELRSNVASNRSSSTINETFDDEYMKELEQAQNLVKEVSQNLSKEIPTIEDLQMPEEVSEGLDPDSLMNKLYTGESNVEYFLEDRYHVRLPIPVYLSMYGGTVKVNIIVNSSGRTVKAQPVQEGQPEQLLSYAKTAALRTRFNPDQQKSTQEGYIIYNFIAQ